MAKKSRKTSAPSAPPKPTCLKCGFISSLSQNKREPPHPRLKVLLSTNAPLLEAEKTSFYKAKEDLPLVISDLDDRIMQTQQLLNALMEERAQVAVDLRHARAVLHPMRALPDDILGEIFSYSTPTWDEMTEAARRFTYHDSLDTKSGPWMLAQVCRNWRSVALSMPSLWSRISLDFNVYFKRNDRPKDVALQLAVHLQRARRSPLSIRIESMSDINLHSAFTTVLSSMTQWRHLHIRTPVSSFHELAKCKPFLESLEEVQIDASLFPIHTQEIKTFQMASNLRQLKLYEHGSFYGHKLHLGWGQLTHLFAQIDSDGIFRYFKELRNLVSLGLSFPTGPRKLDVLSRRIILPKVQYLSLRRRGSLNALNTVAGLFDMLDVPSLRILVFAATEVDGGPMLLDLPSSLSYPYRQLDAVTLDFPKYDLAIPANKSRFLNILSQVSDVKQLTLGVQNIGADVIKKLTPTDDVNFFSRLNTINFHRSTFAVPQNAVQDMLDARKKFADASTGGGSGESRTS
ncbi:hypothetical protein IW261DRAFT_1495374 [Armillaria novae-zelandiae]|uniref:F-box domain-containing protein n=1 Tax=Armillaria novae-zelandiae TaxID=153914 RepID=A0AA39P0S4_9AGAR|nr:hypothetical protein IW261DRAFT_1495374 [Armillaria novae-zelandiae]